MKYIMSGTVSEPKSTHYINSTDGTQIAYQRWGEGPAIVLLHGGGSDRHEWAQAGYVRRLQKSFTVLAPDLRGHGESGLPTRPEDYTPEKYEQDILSVVEACGINHFSIWGMSFGGKVSRYLATRSDRVVKLVLMGTPMGPGVAGQRRQEAIDFSAHWSPLHKALQQGTLEIESLSVRDQEMYQRLNIPAMVGWVPAMLAWPAVEPADFICPTLWLVGSQDSHAMETYFQYKAQFSHSLVQVEILEGLGHEQVFDEIDLIFPTLLSFTLS